MRKELLYIIIFIFNTVSLAQSTFQLVIEKDSTSPTFPAGSIVESNNGDIYAVGTTYPNGGLSTMRLVKMDKWGAVLWDTTYSHTPNQEFFPELMPAHDGGVILACDSYSYPLADEDTIEDILIWKINTNGIIEWQQVLSARNFKDMNITKDGGYILTASIHESEYYQGLDMIAYKIDLEGNIIWSTRLGKQTAALPWDQETPISIIEIDNNTYIAGYHTTITASTQSGVLYQLDEYGNLNWDIFMESLSLSDKKPINSVFKFDDRYYFNGFGLFEFDPITGKYWGVPDSTNFGFRSKGYNYTVDCGVTRMRAIDLSTVSGSYVIQFYDNLLTSYNELEIAQINTNNSYVETIFTKDGGTLTLTTSGSNLIITKTDCMGNIGFWSEECNTKIPNEQDILIYPNPSQNKILIDATFDFDQVIIYSVNGAKVVYNNPCSCSQREMDLSYLAAGVYIVKISNEEQQAISKFVKL